MSSCLLDSVAAQADAREQNGQPRRRFCAADRTIASQHRTDRLASSHQSLGTGTPGKQSGQYEHNSNIVISYRALKRLQTSLRKVALSESLNRSCRHQPSQHFAGPAQNLPTHKALLSA